MRVMLEAERLYEKADKSDKEFEKELNQKQQKK
jgi:hypothetical protein